VVVVVVLVVLVTLISIASSSDRGVALIRQGTKTLQQTIKNVTSLEMV
jgi:hypothetical protein